MSYVILFSGGRLYKIKPKNPAEYKVPAMRCNPHGKNGKINPRNTANILIPGKNPRDNPIPKAFALSGFKTFGMLIVQ
jgi:hypothetical protein